MARRIDFDPPRLSGDLAIVVEGVRGEPRNGYAEYSISRTGALFYGRGDSRAEQSVIWRDREGKRVGQVGRFEILDIFRLSPDGGRIAYSTGDSRGDIWVVDSVRGTSSRISFNGGRASVWSHDGKHIYYRSGGRLFRRAADGSGEEEIVLKEYNGAVYDASPDGKHLLLGGQGIHVLPLTANAKPEPYVYNPKFMERGARFSPDGKWVVYESDESGRQEVYVQGFPERRGKWMVSAGGGRNPVWRGDGKELYWTDLSGSLMAASIELSAASVKPGLPHPLFRDAAYSFEADRDGKRFLVAEREGSEKPIPPMVVVQNWAGRLGK